MAEKPDFAQIEREFSKAVEKYNVSHVANLHRRLGLIDVRVERALERERIPLSVDGRRLTLVEVRELPAAGKSVRVYFACEAWRLANTARENLRTGRVDDAAHDIDKAERDLDSVDAAQFRKVAAQGDKGYLGGEARRDAVAERNKDIVIPAVEKWREEHKHAFFSEFFRSSVHDAMQQKLLKEGQRQLSQQQVRKVVPKSIQMRVPEE